MILESLEVVVPEPLVVRDPVPHRAESFGDEVVAAFAAVPLIGQETGIEQDAKVLGDRRAAHFEVCSNVADRSIGFGEQIQHLASPKMADRCEHIGLAIGSYHHAAIIGKQMLTCQVELQKLGREGRGNPTRAKAGTVTNKLTILSRMGTSFHSHRHRTSFTSLLVACS